MKIGVGMTTLLFLLLGQPPLSNNIIEAESFFSFEQTHLLLAGNNKLHLKEHLHQIQLHNLPAGLYSLTRVATSFPRTS